MSNARANDKYIFKARTRQAFIIKIIGELLSNTIKWAPIRINEKGIFLTQADNFNHQLIELSLLKENFGNNFKLARPLNFIVNSVHLYKMLKSIKKKDTITLFISEAEPLKLGICVEQENEDNQITTFIRINNCQPEILDPLVGYGDPIIMNNKEFQKMKNLHNIDKKLNVTSKPGYIRFFCDGGDLYSREFIVGKIDDDDNKDIPIGFNQNFTTAHITGLAKCAGQSGNVYVYTHEDLPLKIKMKVGDLGDLIVFIKSLEMQEMEKSIKQLDSEEAKEQDDNESVETNN
jgi:hypothetical protein